MTVRCVTFLRGWVLARSNLHPYTRTVYKEAISVPVDTGVHTRARGPYHLYPRSPRVASLLRKSGAH